MSNTNTFYTLAKEFQTKRSALMTEREEKMKQLKPYSTSEGGKRDLAAYNKDFNSRMTALQDKYRTSLTTTLDDMEKNVNKRGIAPTTDAQLRTLEMLKLKKNVTKETLDRAAQAVADNPAALEIVQEIANAASIPVSYTSLCKEMGNEEALKVIKGTRKELNDWLQSDTTFASRHFNRVYTQLHGDDGQNHLVKRVPFEDEKGCFKDLAGLSADKLSAFADAVNGDAADGQ